MPKRKPKKVQVPTEFDKAMRGIVGTPKTEVDKAEEKERKAKEGNREK